MAPSKTVLIYGYTREYQSYKPLKLNALFQNSSILVCFSIYRSSGQDNVRSLRYEHVCDDHFTMADGKASALNIANLQG